MSASPLYFLESDYLDRSNLLLKLSGEIMAPLHHAAARIRSSPDLAATARQCRQRIFGAPEDRKAGLDQLFAVGTEAGMLSALILVSELRQMIGLYRERGIPETVLTDTMSDLETWMRHDLRHNGTWGLSNIRWLINHVTGKLFRLGRLQFMPLQVVGTHWEQVLGPGARVLDIHIPEGARLTDEACLQSYRQAVAFFARHFPEERYGAFVCTSWLLCPQFGQILPRSRTSCGFRAVSG